MLKSGVPYPVMVRLQSINETFFFDGRATTHPNIFLIADNSPHAHTKKMLSTFSFIFE
ncbi:MAG: hypothetical protein M3430_16300 [Acidobacteriota bacterium]|nr:hypothetical protein [Acidobacteriota bacterium]